MYVSNSLCLLYFCMYVSNSLCLLYFCIRHFIRWEFLNFDLNFTDGCSHGLINNIPALVQIMAWHRTTYDCTVYWRIYIYICVCVCVCVCKICFQMLLCFELFWQTFLVDQNISWQSRYPKTIGTSKVTPCSRYEFKARLYICLFFLIAYVYIAKRPSIYCRAYSGSLLQDWEWKILLSVFSLLLNHVKTRGDNWHWISLSGHNWDGRWSLLHPFLKANI